MTRILITTLLLGGSALAQTTAQTPAQTPEATPAQAVAPAPKPAPVPVPKSLDWPNLHRYRADDAAMPPPAPGEQRVVFLGDSITDNWGHKVGVFFPGKPYINRGIGGQTTPQMLVRFEQDVVSLHPAAVVILAGTNDIAGNTGAATPEMIEDNFRAMTAIARQNGIKVILASITPAVRYGWSPDIKPAATIHEVNKWIKSFCASQHLVYLDYFDAMVGDNDAMKRPLAGDGVHPSAEGYVVMSELAQKAIDKTLMQDTP